MNTIVSGVRFPPEWLPTSRTGPRSGMLSMLRTSPRNQRVEISQERGRFSRMKSGSRSSRSAESRASTSSRAGRARARRIRPRHPPRRAGIAPAAAKALWPAPTTPASGIARGRVFGACAVGPGVVAVDPRAPRRRVGHRGQCTSPRIASARCARSGSRTPSRASCARSRPGPSGEVGIYACGPTTYGPIHIGNARPFVIPLLLGRLLRHEGYRPEVVINVTDVNDKIYAAAAERGVPSAEHAAEMIAAYVADTDALGIGRPDHEPRATETIGADRGPDRGADRARPRLRGRRRRLLPRPQLRAVRAALQPRSGRHGPGRGGRRGRAQGGPARLRALEGAQGGRGHVLAEPVGRRQAGLAHRVLGDGRGAARARVRGPRRRLGPRLPPPRERARPDRGRARAAAGPDLDAQRDGPGRARGEDVEVAGQHLPARRGDRRVRGRGRGALPDRRPLPPADRVRRAGAGAGGRRQRGDPRVLPRFPGRLRRSRPRRERPPGGLRRPPSPTTSTRPGRSPSSPR